MIRDHSAQVSKFRIRIQTVDPRYRRVEGALKDGITVQISVWETSPFFRWPKEGEYWSIYYENNIPKLGELLETSDNDLTIESLMPGEALINADSLLVSGSLSIGVSANQIDRFASYEVAWNPDPVDAGETITTTFGVDDAQFGDFILSSLELDLPAGLILQASVSAANTIRVSLVNLTVSTVDLGSTTLHLAHFRCS